MSEKTPLWKVGSAFRIGVTQGNNSASGLLLNRTELQGASPTLNHLFAKPVIVTASSDWKAVSVFSECWWNQLLPRIWRLPKDSPETRKFMKLMFGYSCRVRSDERLILPEALVSYGEFQEQLILLSSNEKYAEIWSESKLAALGVEYEVCNWDR